MSDMIARPDRRETGDDPAVGDHAWFHARSAEIDPDRRLAHA
jgi:hypothetical protein